MDAEARERYRKDIKGRLAQLTQSMDSLKRKAAQQSERRPELDARIAEFETQKKAIEARLRDLDRSEPDGWQKFQSDMEGFFSDMDKSLRQALGYYK